MSFWDLSDGSTAVTNEREFKDTSGDRELIPDGSIMLGAVDEADWAETGENGASFIKLRFSVIKPQEFENRKITMKLFVTDDDPGAKDPVKKRDGARRKLAVIDANAGKKLSKIAGIPTAEQLSLALIGKPMTFTVRIWSMEDKRNPGQIIEGNWIDGIKDKDQPTKIGQSKPRQAAPARAASSGGGGGAGGGRQAPFDADLDDDVPF